MSRLPTSQGPPQPPCLQGQSSLPPDGMTVMEALLPPTRSMPANGLTHLTASLASSARSVDTPLASQGGQPPQSDTATEVSEPQYTGKLAQYALTRTASGRGIGLSAVCLPHTSTGDIEPRALQTAPSSNGTTARAAL